ncbi:MAG TPA: M28 family peptidase [Bryobacteraceae bacterium]|nr:M28 family peptidase [Bryobacteraceae bacterium]
MSVLAIIGAAIAALVLGGFVYLTNMPDAQPLSRPPALDAEGLRRHVEMLAQTIGGRSAGKYRSLQSAADYGEDQLKSFGYTTARQSYTVDSLTFQNIEGERQGYARPEEIVVIGAHYDTAGGLPGANDNASGVAATLELARLHASKQHKRTIRYVLFANEEPPYFQSDAMGSLVYAKRCRERNEKIVAMLSLETIGYYSDEPGSQKYPIGFHPGYPNTGNFLGFVSDIRSVALLRRVVKHFRSGTNLPAQGAAAPSGIPGVGWSDHWSFWQHGYKAVMVTDTAPYRYPYYHTAQDTPDKLDYTRMAQALAGLSAALDHLADR